MKSLVFACVMGIAATGVSSCALAQSAPMTKGVSVNLAETTAAVAFPGADQRDAWIVTITADNRLFLGTKQVTPDSLPQEMKAIPRNSSTKLYLKADARAPFQAVKQALSAAHSVQLETAVLLTAQPQAGQQSPAAPMGLEVRLGAPSAPATLVHVRRSPRSTPLLKINNQDLPWTQLPMLEPVLQKEKEKQKLVVVDGDGTLPFDPIVHVIDYSHSLGAEVALSLAPM